MTPEHQKRLNAWKKRRDKVMRLYGKGVPKAEIARELGVSRHRVHQIVTKEENKVEGVGCG